MRAGWNTLKWDEFVKAIQTFDAIKVTELVHEVATMDGVTKGKTLPLVEGATMIKAIRERYNKVMSGKY